MVGVFGGDGELERRERFKGLERAREKERKERNIEGIPLYRVLHNAPDGQTLLPQRPSDESLSAITCVAPHYSAHIWTFDSQ